MGLMKAMMAAAVALCAVSAPAATAQVVMQQSAESVLRAGTPVALRVVQAVSTKDKIAKVNDRVRLEVAEAVTVGGATVIPAGSPAIGELTDVRYKGMWGKSGRLVGRVLSVNANGRTIRMSGAFDTKGGGGTVGAVAVSAIVFAPAGFFMTGKSAELPSGATVRGFIDEDVPFAVAARAPSAPMSVAPMVVRQ